MPLYFTNYSSTPNHATSHSPSKGRRLLLTSPLILNPFYRKENSYSRRTRRHASDTSSSDEERTDLNIEISAIPTNKRFVMTI